MFKKALIVILYGAVGLVSGLAFSFLGCFSCTALGGGAFEDQKPAPNEWLKIPFFIAELAAPVICTVLGIVLGIKRIRKPPPPGDTPYPPTA